MAGTIPGKDFLALLEEAGFTDAEIAGETGFDTSAVTQGVIIQARKPVGMVKRERSTAGEKVAVDASERVPLQACRAEVSGTPKSGAT
ncbi:hypothetical protein ACFL2Q_01840 [Thermodesulfobacteriota bacterium]